jgi:signal transduction histidine kinase/ActR/RegA family two-component response regulator
MTSESHDITPCKPVEPPLRHRLSYEYLLYRISILAVDAEDAMRFQAECVAVLGEGMAVSRSYIFEHRHKTDTMDNTQEWCAAGIEPQIHRLQGVRSSAVPWWMDTLRSGQAICFSDIEDIPDEGAAEILRSQGILSLLVVPVFVGDRYFGFIGFDDCRSHREWPGEDVEILRTIARIIASVIERQEAESRLQAERSQLLSIFDSIDEPIYVSDPESFEVLFVNKAMRELLGRDPLGGICYRAFHGLDAPCSFCTNEIILAKRGETYRWEHHNPVLGRTFAAHDRIIRWPDGRDVRLELAFDITEQKRLEEQLQAIQRMEAVGQLAGGVAHDFNNLLSVILSYTQFALEGLREEDPLHRDVLEIKKAGERAASLTRQLLAFSRKQVLEPQVLDLNQTVAGMEHMLRRLVGEDVEFTQVLAPDLGRVKADPGQVEQVIMNLVVNARDAMPTGGKLTIETANVELDAEYAREHAVVTPGSYVLLAISDTGSGMDEATRRRLFEPFFTTKELGKGTGLGLSTIYGIVKQSDGYIWAYSEPGRGSTFKVYLPRFLEDAEPTVVRPDEDEPLAGTETILLVEDEEAVRDVAARMLRAAGYQVLTAANGEEALTICEQHKGEIHLLLTDVVMPQMNGPQLAGRIQRLRPDLRILYMSGYMDHAIVREGVLDAGTNYIGKPFSGNDLGRKVRHALGDLPAPRAG